MTNIEYGGLLFGVCLVLIALRMPVAVAMFLVGGFGFASIAGWPAFLNLLNTAPFGKVSSYTLSVLPLFLLMGQLATRSGLSRSCSTRPAPGWGTAAAGWPFRQSAGAPRSAPSAGPRSRPERR